MVTVDPTVAARQASVLALMRAQPDGRLSRELVAQLASQLGVSPATVRRDQAALAKGALPGQVATPPREAPRVYVLPQPAPAPEPRRRGRQAPPADGPAPQGSAPAAPPLEEASADELDPRALVQLPLQDALARLAERALCWVDHPRGDWAVKALQVTGQLLTQRHELIELHKDGDEDLAPEEVERRVVEVLAALPPKLRRVVQGAL